MTPLKQVFLNDFWGSPLKGADSHKSYRPLTVLTFRLNYALGGVQGWTYHIVNIILHGLVSVLFVSVCHAIVPCTSVAFTAGTLFAVHPIHTEAVSCNSVINIINKIRIDTNFLNLKRELQMAKQQNQVSPVPQVERNEDYCELFAMANSRKPTYTLSVN